MFKNSNELRGTEFPLSYSKSGNPFEKLPNLEKWDGFAASEISIQTEGTMKGKIREKEKKLVKKISRTLNKLSMFFIFWKISQILTHVQ